MSAIQFKKCSPHDADQAVPLIYSSGPDAFEYVFQNSQTHAMDFLHYVFKQRGGEFSYDNQYGLYDDGKLIATGSIFSQKQSKLFTLYDAARILIYYKWKSAPILLRGLRIEQIIKLPKKNEISLTHIAVHPDYRSKGLGTRMMKELQTHSEKPPSQRFVLDVSEENPRARALYESLGFVVVKHLISTLKSRYSYVPNHYRMELRNSTCAGAKDDF